MSCSIATGNKKKITFHLSTRVVLDNSFLIHQYGLTLSKSEEINKQRLDSTRLVGECFVLCVYLLFLIFVISHLLYRFIFYCLKRFHWFVDCAALRVCL